MPDPTFTSRAPSTGVADRVQQYARLGQPHRPKVAPKVQRPRCQPAANQAEVIDPDLVLFASSDRRGELAYETFVEWS
jgi:hypothetical protein